MESFKYYLRGKGELDTSNFPQLVFQNYVVIDKLDEKTFVSLLSLNTYIKQCDPSPEEKFIVHIMGYVNHLRGDKDVFSVSSLYGLLDCMSIYTELIQHESTPDVPTPIINGDIVLQDLRNSSPWYTTFVGADASVPKFFPSCAFFAEKIREKGKVKSVSFTLPDTKAKRIVIVDDILGGGATVQMLVDSIRKQGFTGEIALWVQYNEGIHTKDFLSLFNDYYIGDNIHE